MPDSSKIIPLHRGSRIVRAAPPELQRQAADLDAWLNRRKPSLLDDARDFLRDLRGNADIFVFGLTVGASIGALGTVALAFAWAAF